MDKKMKAKMKIVSEEVRMRRPVGREASLRIKEGEKRSLDDIEIKKVLEYASLLLPTTTSLYYTKYQTDPL